MAGWVNQLIKKRFRLDSLLTPFYIGFLEPSVMGGGGHHNFVVTALMIMKFGTNIKLQVFYTMVTKML